MASEVTTSTPGASLEEFILRVPKAELHVHLEGCIEPEMMFRLAARNGVPLRWSDPDELRAAYRFTGLASFLDLYFAGCRVLVQERDFYDVTLDYLRHAHGDGVTHAEVFIGPQSFTERGVPLDALMQGVFHALRDAARELGISGGLLISVHRHRTEADAMAVLESVAPWAVVGIGMGGAERGNPPSKFQRFFAACRDRGFRTTVHAGEEGPAAYVREALELLQVDRIDHGNACLDDPALVQELAERSVPLTVCPLSNVRLQVVPSLDDHPLRRMLEAGLRVTLNSDDPPYFGGYVAENYRQCARSLNLTADEIALLARNSFLGSFLPDAEVARSVAAVDACLAEWRASTG